jgi:TPR repeat protein
MYHIRKMAQWISISVTLLWALPGAAAPPPEGPRVVRHGITLTALPLPAGETPDIPTLGAPNGLARLATALDVLMEKSPFAADALATMKRNGRVVILYDPAFPKNTRGTLTIAAFMPGYFNRQSDEGGRGDFIAVIGRYGIRWSPRELAGVIGHELIGHGLQYLRRRNGSMRQLDRECQARLYQERISQDLGVNKKSLVSIRLRRELEGKFCADFKRYLALQSPRLARLWDPVNPDIPRLLDLFEGYLKDPRQAGITRSALDAEARDRFRKLRVAAEAGDVAAQNRLGMILEFGQGRKRNDAQAVRWYRKAARQGLPEAETNLGHMYERGRGVARDPAEAAKWYRRAAERGFARAQHNLAILYDKGRGMARDPVRALVWLRRAAEQGFAPSLTSLGFAYQNGRGVARDGRVAAKWYRRAARRGHAVAQYLLARLYDLGNGVARDPAEAYLWYGLAGKRGAGDLAARADRARTQLAAILDKTTRVRIDARIRDWQPVDASK